MSGPVRSNFFPNSMAAVEAVRAARGLGPAPWTLPHNIAVVTAWWTVSGNPLFRGTNNKVEILWKAVHNEYDRLLNLPAYQAEGDGRVQAPQHYRARTWRGLQSRFKSMQLLINRFIGDYSRARFIINASGSDEARYLKDAHIMYVRKWKKPFKLMPEFLFLKGFPKYLFDVAQAAKQ